MLSLIFFQGACYLAVIRVLEVCLGNIAILGIFPSYYHFILVKIFKQQ